MPDVVLEATDVHKSYQTGSVVTPVLHGLDLTVRPSEFVVIMGPSGCGKSTLLHVLGLMTPASAARSIRIEGQETVGFNERRRTQLRREKIGFVFQRFNLLPVISAVDNVRLAMRLRQSAADGTLDGLFEQIGLSDVKNKKPGALSIGEQQRVAIARAIACRPRLLLADEPTGNLDSQNADRVLDLLEQFHARYGQTTIMVTHNEHCADRADRVLRMKDGRFED